MRLVNQKSRKCHRSVIEGFAILLVRFTQNMPWSLVFPGIMAYLVAGAGAFVYQSYYFKLFYSLESANTGLPYHELLTLWHQQYGNAPYPNEYCGWFIAGVALLSTFAVLAAALVCVIIVAFLPTSLKEKVLFVDRHDRFSSN